MNKLELVKRFSRESKINATGPTSTLNQVGQFLKCVEWIDAAYEAVQNDHPDYKFLRDDFEFTMTSGDGGYTAADAGVTDLSRWIEGFSVYLTSVADESYVVFMEWDDFKANYGFGSHRTATGRPIVYTIKPDDSLYFYPIPDAAYTCEGEYYKTPDVMEATDTTEADDAEPIFNSNFHMVIVWRALILYAPHSAQADRFVQGVNEYKSLKRKMETKYLPPITTGGPLV